MRAEGAGCGRPVHDIGRRALSGRRTKEEARMRRPLRSALLRSAVLCALTGGLLASCAPAAPKQEASAPAATPETQTALAPVKSGYAEINGIRMYHEIYGQGEPMVLIHGGLTTIGEIQGLVQPLAKTRQVIAVEMQGHGHTADTDRPMSLEQMGDDIAALLDHLEIPKADLVGHSFGGDSAIRAAIQHPDKVRRLVVISAPHRHSAWYPEVQEGMSQVSAALAENMMQTPTGQLSKEWPEPRRFPQFLDKMGKMMGEDYDWSAEVAKLPMPVLLVFADNDSVPQKNIAEFFGLLGGGIKEPGWQNTQLSKSRLAIVSGYSHYNFHTAPELPPIIDKFLADPLTNPPAGAAAASQAAP
jgi:pimeloyl-ACP methyl ester carboxylesterase